MGHPEVRLATENIPTLHDGYFDGLWLSGEKRVHIFVRTEAGERSTIVLGGVEALTLWDVKQGNIISDLVVTAPENLTASQIREVHNLPEDSKHTQEILRRTQEKRLSLLDMSTSYGAYGLVLFETAEIVPGHVLPNAMGSTED